MPVLSRLVSMVLRICEIGSAAVIAGIVGNYLDYYTGDVNWPLARYIYSIIVAGLSMLLALIWLMPTASTFYVWPIDVVVSLAWFAVFGIFIDWIKDNCNSPAFDFHDVSDGGFCGRWRTAEAFAFISACLWLVSALVGIWFIRRERSRAAAAKAALAGEPTTCVAMVLNVHLLTKSSPAATITRN